MSKQTVAQQTPATSPLSQGGILQRKCETCGQHTVAGGECEGCKKELSLQRRATSQGEISEVPPIVYEVLNSPGQPLDRDTRSFMESRFERDFSQVRVHTDTKAAASARAVNALAYTVQRNIAFGSGQYVPGTTKGQRLLAHELAHVVQQADQPVSRSTDLSVGNVGNVYEQEAEASADWVVNENTQRPTFTVQKSPKPSLMRTTNFSSTMEICHRVLFSRVFEVSQGGLVVTANAGWEASSEWEGTSRPQCGREVYNMTLNQKGLIFDSEYGSCEFEMGRPFSRRWTNLPEGDYNLTIWTNNTNPNCCLRGDIVVSEQSELGGETCTQPPPGPLEILHTALDIAGLVPALGAIPDTINAGIYLVEGDWLNAGLSAVSIIPIFGDAASVTRVGGKIAVRIPGEAVERVGRDGIATGLRETRVSRRGAIETAEEAGSAARRHPHGTETPHVRVNVPGLPRCRTGSLFCPIDFLRQEFTAVFDARNSSEFARYVRELPEIDLSMGRSLRSEQTILTGNEMYAQYLREVSRSQWSEPFSEAVSLARREGVDYREIVVGGQRHRWPLDDLGSPWVVHHDPPLGWVTAESNQWWHPMPYRIHDDAHNWWRQLERRVKSRIPPEMRQEILEGTIDIRDL